MISQLYFQCILQILYIIYQISVYYIIYSIFIIFSIYCQILGVFHKIMSKIWKKTLTFLHWLSNWKLIREVIFFNEIQHYQFFFQQDDFSNLFRQLMMICLIISYQKTIFAWYLKNMILRHLMRKILLFFVNSSRCLKKYCNQQYVSIIQCKLMEEQLLNDMKNMKKRFRDLKTTVSKQK